MRDLVPSPRSAHGAGTRAGTPRRSRWPALVTMVVALSSVAAAEARPFEMLRADVREVDGVYLLDAVARLRLTKPVRQALRSGVDLGVTWRVEIVRARPWWLDADVAALSQRYRLAYHALSRQYLVTNLNTGERRSFVELNVALYHIGRLFDFPLIDRMLIAAPAQYTGRAQVFLDHGALPWSLRPTVLFSSPWDLTSEWRSWSFE